jgi:hypothetical protein
MVSRKQSLIEAGIGTFLRAYARKAQKGKEPNDRHYDRKVEALTKRLAPEDLSALISGEGDQWKPISATELQNLLVEQLARCSDAQRHVFEAHRTVLRQVAIHRFGATEEVFAVAQFGDMLLFYDDIEEGFELAALGEDGAILQTEYNQLELHQVLHRLGYA